MLLRDIVVEDDPWVFHDLVARNPGRRVSDQHFAYQVFSAIGDILPDRIIKVIVAPFDLIKQFEAVLTVKRKTARQHGKQDHTDAENIAGLVVRLLIQYFRRDVPWCPTGCLCKSILFNEARKTEIRYFQDGSGGIASREKQIFWLQIPVDYAHRMAINKCINDWHQCFSRLRLCQPFSFDDLIEKLATPAVLHHKEKVLLILVDIIKFYNVWVINLFQNFYFILNGRSVICSEFFLGDHFHSDPLSVCATDTFSYGGKSTFANDMPNFIVNSYVAKLRIFLHLLL